MFSCAVETVPKTELEGDALLAGRGGERTSAWRIFPESSPEFYCLRVMTGVCLESAVHTVPLFQARTGGDERAERFSSGIRNHPVESPSGNGLVSGFSSPESMAENTALFRPIRARAVNRRVTVIAGSGQLLAWRMRRLRQGRFQSW